MLSNENSQTFIAYAHKKKHRYGYSYFYFLTSVFVNNIHRVRFHDLFPSNRASHNVSVFAISVRGCYQMEAWVGHLFHQWECSRQSVSHFGCAWQRNRWKTKKTYADSLKMLLSHTWVLGTARCNERVPFGKYVRGNILSDIKEYLLGFLWMLALRNYKYVFKGAFCNDMVYFFSFLFYGYGFLRSGLKISTGKWHVLVWDWVRVWRTETHSSSKIAKSTPWFSSTNTNSSIQYTAVLASKSLLKLWTFNELRCYHSSKVALHNLSRTLFGFTYNYCFNWPQQTSASFLRKFDVKMNNL